MPDGVNVITVKLMKAEGALKYGYLKAPVYMNLAVFVFLTIGLKCLI